MTVSDEFGLETDGALHRMQDRPGVAEGGGVDAAVDAVGLELVDGRHHVLGLVEVDDVVDADPVRLGEREPLGHVVDGDDAPRAAKLAPSGGE